MCLTHAAAEKIRARDAAQTIKLEYFMFCLVIIFFSFIINYNYIECNLLTNVVLTVSCSQKFGLSTTLHKRMVLHDGLINSYSFVYTFTYQFVLDFHPPCRLMQPG